MKGGRQGCPDHPCRICNLSSAFEPIAVLYQGHQTVIRKHKVLSAPRLRHNRLARAAYTRIDHYHEHGARGVVRADAIEKTRSIKDRERGDLMGEVHYAQLGSDRIHHSFADSD